MPLTGEYAPSPADFPRRQAEEYEASGGVQAATMQGRPIVVVTTVGRRSGKLRKTPLMRVEHDGCYLLVASLGGAPKHPVWYLNILEHPQVELQDGGSRQDMVARELSGPERDVWWQRAVDAFPNYAAYQRKTSRVIPLLLLEPR